MRPRRSHYLLAIILLPCLFLLQRPAIREPIREFSLSVLKPAIEIGEAVANVFSNAKEGIAQFWESFQDRGVMKSKIAVLESELLRFEEMGRENLRLKKLLDFRMTMKEKNIGARVIGWDPSPWRKIVILDKGRNQGIEKDMAVLVPEGLAGRVFEVGPETSSVILLIDADSRVSALADVSRVNGMIEGNGSSKLEMTYLDMDSEASVGEIVITSGVGGLFPKGIRVGKITNLSKDPNGLHLVARIEPFVRFSKLEEVLCTAHFRAE